MMIEKFITGLGIDFIIMFSFLTAGAVASSDIFWYSFFGIFGVVFLFIIKPIRENTFKEVKGR